MSVTTTNVREINKCCYLSAMGSLRGQYVFGYRPDGTRNRIIRARTRKGVLEAKFLSTGGWEPMTRAEIGW